MEKTISIVWSTSDIIARAFEMEVKITKKDANNILDNIERTHDATIGINWDVITCHIQEFIDNKLN